jgi:AraC-like DNA-binding protein
MANAAATNACVLAFEALPSVSPEPRPSVARCRFIPPSCTILPDPGGSGDHRLASRPIGRERTRMHPLDELTDTILRHTASSPLGASQNELLSLKFSAARAASPEPIHRVYEPVFSLVVQGEKKCVVGDRLFTCGRGKFLVVSVDLPIMVHISVASTKLPYVALGIKLKPAHVASLLLETAASECATVESAGMGISDASTELLDAVVRLVRLLDHPRDVAVLGPLAEREILWRLLCSEQGHRVRQIGLADSRLSQIGRAIRWIRENYRESLTIEELARISAMSVTSFHRQFRAVTLMSPIQYLKQIRLQEARGRLLAGLGDVATIGHAVGYDSPSQFSREYKRAYGLPPGEDARLLRASTSTPAARLATSTLRNV